MSDIFEEKTVTPMLIAENVPAFDDPGYIFELKLDGVRALAYLSQDGTELRNKRNKRLSATFPELAGMHRQAKARCIIDGELVVMSEGAPDFFRLQRRSLMTNPMRISHEARQFPVSFTAFDILYRSGEVLTGLPLEERKTILGQTLAESPSLAVSRWIESEGTALFAAAASRGLEGIVGKRIGSRYHPGKRTRDWLKCKALVDEDFVVCGYWLKEAATAALILGLYDGGELVSRGHVTVSASRGDFGAVRAQRRVPKSPLYKAFPDADGAVWLEPRLVCAVQYMERTPSGAMRQPVFRGVRDDKTALECRV